MTGVYGAGLSFTAAMYMGMGIGTIGFNWAYGFDIGVDTMGGISLPLYFLKEDKCQKMHNFDIIMNNYFFRVIASLISIIIGLFLLMCYLHRDKKNTWGQIYLSLYESLNQIAKLGKSEKMERALHDKLWLLFAIFCIFGGIRVIFFGFG